MLQTGSKIKLYDKTVTVISVTDTEVLIQKENGKQPQWVKLDIVRMFNKI